MWAAQTTFKVGDLHIGVRSSTRDCDAILKRVLREHVVDDPQAPPNYSIKYPEADARKGVYRIYSGSMPVLRTRSPARLFWGLLSVLGSFAQPEDSSLLKISVRPLLYGSEALLTPLETVYMLDLIEPRARRLGLDYLPHGRPMLDPASGELVLLESNLVVDDDPIRDLMNGDGSLPGGSLPPLAGRFPIRQWISFGSGPDHQAGLLTPAAGVAMALKAVHSVADEGSQRVLEGLARVFAGPRRARGVAVEGPNTANLIAALTEAVA